ncbi:MAG: PCRF domain-containing protein [Microgenomates group bacterium]
MHDNPYQTQIDELTLKIEESTLLLSDPEMAALAQDEIDRLTAEREVLTSASAEYQSQSTGEQEIGSTRYINCTFEIRAGAGGDEAKIWGADLLRMYMRFAETIGIKYQVIDDLVVKFIGKTSDIPQPDPEKSWFTAYELFQYESGVHRVQRVPETESQGRIHTSTASVAVLPEVPASAVTVRDEDLDWQFMRAGGAGGQSVNKTSSAVRLTHVPSGIVIVSRQERKQAQNRQIALELLRSQLWEIEEEKRLSVIGNARAAIGRARRAEKIRTFNFPQNRVTDHRTKQSWHNLSLILEGTLTTVLTDLHAEMYALENSESENISVIPQEA